MSVLLCWSALQGRGQTTLKWRERSEGRPSGGAMNKHKVRCSCSIAHERHTDLKACGGSCRAAS